MAKNDKQERFDRVAYARKEKILELLRLLGNCANMGNYEYNHKQVKKIFDDIDDAVKNTKKEFEKQVK